jgi:cell division protein ZapA (FtsZ GTPase activity inhibitor)
MKQRISVEIAGTTLNLVTDEPEEYVKRLAEILDERITRLSIESRYSRMETLLLIAMDYLDDHIKDTAKRKALEQQLAALTEMTSATEPGDTDE